MLAAGNYLRPECTFTVLWNSHGHLANRFQRVSQSVGAFSMIPLTFKLFVAFTTHGTGQLCFHEIGPVLSNALFDIASDCIKNFSGSCRTSCCWISLINSMPSDTITSFASALHFFYGMSWSIPFFSHFQLHTIKFTLAKEILSDGKDN